MILQIITLGISLAAIALLVRTERRKIIRSNQAVIEAVEQLRLKSRAKVVTTKMKSGSETEEQQLVRMGRATRAKRVIFGGDPDAPQHTSLGKSLEKGNDE